MRFTIKDSVFPVEIRVLINLTEKEVKSLIARKKLPHDSMESYENPGWVISEDGTTTIVFNGLPSVLDEYNIGVIAHECCHAVFATFRHIGENPQDAEETFCYHIQFLTEKIIKKINQKYKNECRKRDNGNKTAHEAPRRSDDGSVCEAKQSSNGNKGEQPVSDGITGKA